MRKHHGPVGAEVGGDDEQRNREPTEVAPRNQVAAQHRSVEQGVGLRLVDGGILQVEAMVTLLPDEQRLQLSQRAGRPRIESAEQGPDRKGARQRVDGGGGIAAGIHGADGRTHAAADDQVGADAQAVQRAQQSDMRQPLGAAAGQHQCRARGGALLCGRGARSRQRKQHKGERPDPEVPHGAES